MKMSMFYSLLFAVIVSVSCVKAEGLNDPPADTGLNLSNAVNKELLLQLVNEARKKGCRCGDTYFAPAPALVWNDLLEKAAFKHVRDMYQNNYFSHIGRDGSTVSQRMERAGYNWMAYGENIGAGYKNEKEVIEGWLSSPGHCKNIMNRKYKEMAVARVGDYWTQTLGAR